MNEPLRRGMTSLALSVAMLVVGTMAEHVYPQETAYVFWLFLFGASLFLADAAVTMTRFNDREAAADERRDRAANPWRVAFGLAFVLTLFAAARTGSSFVTVTAMLVAVVAAGVYLVRRRFFGNLRDMLRGGDPARRLRDALKAKDHAELARMIEERAERETDPGRKNALLLSLGAIHVVRGEYDAAVKAFERLDRRVRTEKTSDGRVVDMGYVVDLNLASAFIAKGDFAEAERCLDRIVEERLAEEFRLAYDVNRSALLVGKGAHAESIRFVESLDVPHLPRDSQLPFLRDLAESLAASGSDPARALAVARQCLDVDEGPQALNVMAFVLLAEKKFDDAMALLERAIAANPEGATNLRVFAESLYYLGLAKKGKGLSSDAAELFRRAAGVKGGGRFAMAAAREAGTA
ncbi:MAG TPA: hypothetical protein VMV18_01040 [bacterium]|nr:hypothetical protein [bacterium]